MDKDGPALEMPDKKGKLGDEMGMDKDVRTLILNDATGNLRAHPGTGTVDDVLFMLKSGMQQNLRDEKGDFSAHLPEH